MPLALFAPISLGDAHAQGRVQLRGEAGLEHDSNPARTEIVDGEPEPDIHGSAAARFVGNGSGWWAAGSRTSLSFSGSAALRLYQNEEVERESVGILRGSAAANQRLGDNTALVGSFAYYDAFQQNFGGARDFRSLSPTGRLQYRLAGGTLSGGGGYRWFTFKAFPDFNFSGPLGFLSYRRLVLADLDKDPEGADWEVSTSVSVERRNFAGTHCLESTCTDASALGKRTDDFTVVGAELTRTTDFLVGAGASAQLNASNSFGDGLIRIAAHAKGAFVLPWELTLTVRAELLFSSYSSSVPLAADPITGRARASIDEESRNTLRVEIVKPIGTAWDVALRSIAYTNELGGGPSAYRRFNTLLVLGYAYDSAGDG